MMVAVEVARLTKSLKVEAIMLTSTRISGNLTLHYSLKPVVV